MTYTWSRDLSDEDYSPGWLCNLPDGSEMFVEQIVWPSDGRTMWRSLIRIGEDGAYNAISGAFSSRLEAQTAAECMYASRPVVAVTFS